MPQIRLTIRLLAVTLATLSGAAPALAQGVGQGTGQGVGKGTPSETAAPAPARAVTSSGQTIPRPRQPSVTPTLTAADTAEMLKAQKASQARSKSWDDKMHRTMGSICHGC